MKTNAFCCRLLLSALSLLLAAGCLTSCGGSAVQETSAAPETTSAVTTTETEAPQEFFKLTGEVCVVRPEGAISDDLLTAVKLMTSAGKALVGGVNVIESGDPSAVVAEGYGAGGGSCGVVDAPSGAGGDGVVIVYGYVV